MSAPHSWTRKWMVGRRWQANWGSDFHESTMWRQLRPASLIYINLLTIRNQNRMKMYLISFFYNSIQWLAVCKWLLTLSVSMLKNKHFKQMTCVWCLLLEFAVSNKFINFASHSQTAIFVGGVRLMIDHSNILFLLITGLNIQQVYNHTYCNNCYY